MLLRLENRSKVGNLKKRAIGLTLMSVICTMSGYEKGFKVFGNKDRPLFNRKPM